MSVYTGSIGPWPNLYVIHEELKSKQSAQQQRLVSNEHLDTIPLQHLQMFSGKVKLGYSRLPLYRNIITKTDQGMVANAPIQAKWSESTADMTNTSGLCLKGEFLEVCLLQEVYNKVGNLYLFIYVLVFFFFFYINV